MQKESVLELQSNLSKFSDGIGLTNKDDHETVQDKYRKTTVNYFIYIRTLISRYDHCGIRAPYTAQFQAFQQSKTYLETDHQFGKLVGSVEILRDDRLEVVLFQIPDIVVHQANAPSFKDTQTDLIYTVRRESQHTKLDDFLTASDDMIYELTSNPRIKRSWPVKFYEPISDLTFLMAVMLNMLSLVDEKQFSNDGINADAVHGAIYAMGVVQLVLSIIRMIAIGASYGPTIYHQFCKDHEGELLI